MSSSYKIVNDPVYGQIRVAHNILQRVIDHPYFQRLRRISQTANLSLTFPGATHTRFAHALGAMHLMERVLETLRRRGIEISEEEERASLLAILMHDIGHGPYSHTLEHVILEGVHHEEISLLLMQQINMDFGGELDMAIQIFNDQYPRKFFHQILSSQLDVDRLDYLKRDSFYAGVAEGNIHTGRLITMMNVVDDQLVVDAKGINSVQHFLMARMLMYWQVYYHRTSVMSEKLLTRIFRRARMIYRDLDYSGVSKALDDLLSASSLDLTKEKLEIFTRLDDHDILQAVKSWQDSEDPIIRYLCRALVFRRFPRIEVSSQAFDPQHVMNLSDKCCHYFKTADAHMLVEAFQRSLLPYDAMEKPILLYEEKTAKIFPLDKAPESLFDSWMGSITTRHYLSYPRELF